MTHSLDSRQKVINFIEAGGSITKASKIFKVGRSSIYRWLGREDLAPTKVEHRKKKVDIKELEDDVEKNPNIPLKERAQKFGVTSASLCYRFKKMKIKRKKTTSSPRKKSR